MNKKIKAPFNPGALFFFIVLFVSPCACLSDTSNKLLIIKAGEGYAYFKNNLRGLSLKNKSYPYSSFYLMNYKTKFLLSRLLYQTDKYLDKRFTYSKQENSYYSNLVFELKVPVKTSFLSRITEWFFIYTRRSLAYISEPSELIRIKEKTYYKGDKFSLGEYEDFYALAINTPITLDYDDFYSRFGLFYMINNKYRTISSMDNNGKILASVVSQYSGFFYDFNMPVTDLSDNLRLKISTMLGLGNQLVTSGKNFSRSNRYDSRRLIFLSDFTFGAGYSYRINDIIGFNIAGEFNYRSITPLSSVKSDTPTIHDQDTYYFKSDIYLIFDL